MNIDNLLHAKEILAGRSMNCYPRWVHVCYSNGWTVAPGLLTELYIKAVNE